MATWNNTNGFSLLSVLIAAMMVSTGSIAAASLVVRADQVAVQAQERFVAVQIAREGLELVRARRDSNWFGRAGDAARTWMDGLCEQPVFMLDANMVRTGETVIEVDPASTAAGRLYLIPVTAGRGGEWTHQAEVPAKPTQYERIISLDCARKDEGVVQVTSLVRWAGRPGQPRVILKEELYDWLPAP